MDALSRLVDALRCLPGVGPKSAQRMAFHLLNNRQNGRRLADCLNEAMQSITHCLRCNNYTVKELCDICTDTQRESTTLCVVETPSDVMAIEHSGAYKGCYYVLMGKISPIDGIGSEHIGLPRLQKLVIENGIKEVILALSPTLEGQTTVYFIQTLLGNSTLRMSQLAHGIPSGGELEFLDSNTIGSALRNRATII